MPKHKTLTKAQESRYRRLIEKECDAMHRVFEHAPHPHARWSECYAAAPADVKAVHSATERVCRAFEDEMIAQGRGYIDDDGRFRPY